MARRRGNLRNFGGKRALPFTKTSSGGKRPAATSRRRKRTGR